MQIELERVRSKGKPTRGSSKPLTIPEGKPVSTRQILRLYGDLIDNAYGMPAEDAVVLAMEIERNHPEFRKLRNRLDKSERVLLKRIRRPSRIMTKLRKVLTGVLWVVVAMLGAFLILILWQRWGW